MTKQNIKSVFISDVHLGLKQCKAKELLKFLKKYKYENLFILGDFFDGYKLKRKFYWCDDYLYLIKYIIGKIKDGKNIVYISGNHDDFLRKIEISDLSHIKVYEEYIYQSNGHKILLIHGDKFDMAIRGMTFLYWFGSYGYDFLLWFQSFWEKICWLFRLPRTSISKYIKKKVKYAINFVTSFEEIMIKYANDSKCDIVIGGHIHFPHKRTIDHIEYYNCGDWVEHNSAVIEDLDGNFEIVYY